MSEYLDQSGEVIIEQLRTRERPSDGTVGFDITITDYLEGKVRDTRGLTITDPGFSVSGVSFSKL